jgi:hypothetical protein
MYVHGSTQVYVDIYIDKDRNVRNADLIQNHLLTDKFFISYFFKVNIHASATCPINVDP